MENIKALHLVIDAELVNRVDECRCENRLAPRSEATGLLLDHALPPAKSSAAKTKRVGK